ncbi:hypothetical protein V8F20_010720 [Naviculisporaceae sp. PSN 640]
MEPNSEQCAPGAAVETEAVGEGTLDQAVDTLSIMTCGTLSTEQDITDFGFPSTSSATPWPQSTDGLVPTCASLHSDSDRGDSVEHMADPEQISCAQTPSNSPKLPTISVQVQLADSQHNDTRPSRATSTSSLAECDAEWIELDELPSAVNRSTEQLIPPLSLPQLNAIDNTSIDIDTESGTTPPETRSEPRVYDYKPLPLRWPFQVFLVCLIAGVFGFFEYEMHHLPPVHFQLFQPAPPSKGILDDGAIIGTKLTPGAILTSPETPQATAHKVGNQFIKVAAPEPTPDPRPPASLYPAPVMPVTTHCGWGSPQFGIHLWPGWGKDGYYGVPGSGAYEYRIPTFYTDDESWCPCTDDLLGSYNWGDIFALRPSGGASSHDTECQSVLRAVINHNEMSQRAYDDLGEGPVLEEARARLLSIGAEEPRLACNLTGRHNASKGFLAITHGADVVDFANAWVPVLDVRHYEFDFFPTVRRQHVDSCIFSIFNNFIFTHDGSIVDVWFISNVSAFFNVVTIPDVFIIFKISIVRNLSNVYIFFVIYRASLFDIVFLETASVLCAIIFIFSFQENSYVTIARSNGETHQLL